MASTDPRVDNYIMKSADFARPILEHLRKLIHKGCPGAVETIKWSRPFFEYNGALLCYIIAFKQHCSFGFWNAGLLSDPAGVLRVKDKNSRGHFDRITSLQELPVDKVIIAYVKEAAALNLQDAKKQVKEQVNKQTPAKVTAKPKAALPVPDALAAALKKNKKAQTVFDGFAPSHRREYIEWITEAKTEPTRDKRIATTLEWLVEGKSRNWQYQKKGT
jgi:uncharacterized protein YdeI (YjbR/CyaY-like superfamily)